jgi:hypothetical protein
MLLARRDRFAVGAEAASGAVSRNPRTERGLVVELPNARENDQNVKNHASNAGT